MKSTEFVGALGTMIRPSVECLHGDFMGSIAESIDGHRAGGRNRWRPARILRNLAVNIPGGIIFSREWPKVARDHSRSRHSNQRP